VICDRAPTLAYVAHRVNPGYLSTRPKPGFNRATWSRMFGLDEWIVKLGSSGILALLVAILLGLRHATDPDHLTAVSTLFLADNRHGPRRATLLGLAWGLGHAATLFGFGIPVVLFRRYLPDPVQRGAEAVIGLLIALLAVRLLVRWRRGYFHLHAHNHAGVRHAHPHAHEHSGGSEGHPVQHVHSHAEALGRTPLAAFGIGLVHGVGGSAGVGVLLVSGATGRVNGVVALLAFAAATAVSMALASTAFGYALARGAVRRRLTDLVPVLGAASLIFGIWYSLGALQGPG
jgi:ABC-type nickel/cobalt efflux system permease component RcnA